MHVYTYISKFLWLLGCKKLCVSGNGLHSLKTIPCKYAYREERFQKKSNLNTLF